MAEICYELPFPPSLNRIWRTVAGRIVLSADARKYAIKIVNALPKGKIEPLTGRLSVTVALYPPDKLVGKAWDVMNREKVLCDALTKARVWLDDSQIDSFTVYRTPNNTATPDGYARMTIWHSGA